MPSATACCAERGLTLLEMLVTLVITAMAAAILSNAMQQLARVELRLQDNPGESQTVMVRREWIRALFATVFPERVSVPLQFAGDERTVHFASAEALDLQGTTLGRVRLELAAGGGEGQQVVRLVPESAADLAVAGTVLLSWTGEPGRMEYLDNQGHWLAGWPVADPEAVRRPPRAVRLLLGDAAGGPLLAVIASTQGPRPSLAALLQ